MFRTHQVPGGWRVDLVTHSGSLLVVVAVVGQWRGRGEETEDQMESVIGMSRFCWPRLQSVRQPDDHGHSLPATAARGINQQRVSQRGQLPLYACLFLGVDLWSGVQSDLQGQGQTSPLPKAPRPPCCLGLHLTGIPGTHPILPLPSVVSLAH